MILLIHECNEMLKNQGFEYAFCGGYALDIHSGQKMRPHGDIDVSVYWEDRSHIIAFMQAQGWRVYEAMGDGKVHLITDVESQKFIKSNIFCVKEGCSFFHVELIENDVYECDIDDVEQKKLDYIEFLFNRRSEGEFVYSRNNAVRREIDKAILNREDIAYLAPELVLLYKSTDLSRDENKQDFEAMTPLLSDERKKWLQKALITAFPDGHEWIKRLELL